jgi:hypothetical protein
MALKDLNAEDLATIKQALDWYIDDRNECAQQQEHNMCPVMDARRPVSRKTAGRCASTCCARPMARRA